ncbi:MAG: sarcosine oxidase subunit alpha [Gammaproteobacteria bacterium]|jgi:sarcosine oxidase subunit alpha
MSARYRNSTGGKIQRNEVISFRFNGKRYDGFAGDTLASALLANGVHLTARSFKYHRPRGTIGSGYEEPSALVELTGDESSANQPITTVKIRTGLEARSVNCWPSPGFDLMAINQLFAPLIPAAFYYKTFMWPTWHLFEPSIRKAAGLAAAPKSEQHEGHYEVRNAHCDILVVGAGPAGLISALLAAKNGLRIILVDDGSEPGGSLLNESTLINGKPAFNWIDLMVEQLDQLDNVQRLSNATAWAYREQNLIIVNERKPQTSGIFQRGWRVRASRVILATGAIERNLVYPNNDRPGIMLASAVRSYVNRYAVLPGKKAVIFTNNNSAYSLATELELAGIEVVAIVDSRSSPNIDSDSKITVLKNHVIETTAGHKRIKRVSIKDLNNGQKASIDCDLLCVSGGWNPTLHLFSQARGNLQWNKKLVCFTAGSVDQHCHCTGSAAGFFNLDQVIENALETTQEIIQLAGFTTKELLDLPEISPQSRYDIAALWQVECESKLQRKSFVDIQNDVTVADIHLALREGFESVEHVKRYTTAGMGIDQGKTGNLNVIGIIANATSAQPEEIGTTTFRSPFSPIEFGSIVGSREGVVFLPYRHTQVTQWHRDKGATIYESGARWRRPGFYPREGEAFQQTVDRESLAVRNRVGVYDGAPLGKYEIKGPDATKFLNMLYTNEFGNLKINRGRYGLMLTEDGRILDDGVSFKLAENHYLMSTSTGYADLVNQHMEYFLQVHRPEWQVKISTVTTQWANATICGPDARKLLEAIGTDIDLSADQFPFMSMRNGTVAGIPARICRVSFTGELSFEVNVWPRYFRQLWDTIIDVGKSFDITPIGSEANHVLRVEKGFLSLGHEADGVTDPYDLGMDWIMSSNKDDYIGKTSVRIRRQGGHPRRELVGLMIDDPQRMVEENAPITPGGRREASEGFVTACVWSVVLNRSIALALLTNGQNRMGGKVYIRMKEDIVTATVTKPCFHDPQGQRLRS